MLCRVTAVKSLPVNHFYADYIFLVLWDHWIHCYFENGILFKPVQGDVASLAHFISCHEHNQLNSN